jgi:hypothetical protein
MSTSFDSIDAAHSAAHESGEMFVDGFRGDGL